MVTGTDGGTLIGQYFDDNELVTILSNLIEKDQLDEVLGVLNIISLDLSKNAGVVDKLFKLVTSKLYCHVDSLPTTSFADYSDNAYHELLADEELRIIAQLICRLEPLRNHFETWIEQVIATYLVAGRTKLFEDDYYGQVCCALNCGGNRSEITDTGAVFLLKFLELVFSLGEDTLNKDISHSSGIYNVMLLLLGCNIEILSFTASCLLRWKMVSVAEKCAKDEKFDMLIWTAVRLCYRSRSDSDWKFRNALIFTLRFLLVSEKSAQLKLFIQTNEYWQALQDALAHDIHEYRKLGITVLNITIDKLASSSSSFTTAIFKWDPTREEASIEVWNHFTTLYQIVALEPALNQIQAATDQIMNLLSNSLLHPTWSLIIFSTGMKATMESVRKYMVSLLFKVSDKSIFSIDFTTLKNNFLPAALEAQYFVVHDSSCPYGELLSSFVTAVITENKKTPQAVISAVLELLVEQPTIFDPSRVYLTFGVLNSLKRKNSRLISPYHMQLIKKLFDVESEEEIVETTLQTMNLKFLLHVDPSVSPQIWIRTIAAHIKNSKNGYKFFKPLIEDFKDFAIAYFDMGEVRNSLANFVDIDVTFDLLSMILYECSYIKVSPLTVKEMSKCGISKKEVDPVASGLLSDLLMGDQDAEEYSDSYLIVNYPGFNVNTWSSVRTEELYASLLQQFSKDKFKLFAAIYEKAFENNVDLIDLRWSDVRDLYPTIKSYLNTQRDFKLRDETYGSYMRFLCSFLRACALDWTEDEKGDELSQLLTLLKENVTNDNGTFLGNLYVSKLCDYILSSYVATGKGTTNKDWTLVLRVIDIMSLIWEEVFSKRLVLIQKSLHVALIDGFFHPSVLYCASDSSENGTKLASIVSNRGRDILNQASTRRGYLPLLAQKINSFVVHHATKLNNPEDNHWWLIRLMLGTFTSTQLAINVFFLRPVIAKLFDKKINTYHDGGKSLYEQVYGPEEISAKILIIDAFLQSDSQLKQEFLIQTMKKSNLLYPNKQTDGVEEVKRILQFELLLLGIQFYEKNILCDFVRSSILPSLSNERSPLVRTYKEWFTAYALAELYQEEKPEVVEDTVVSSVNDHSKPAFTASNERIVFLALEALTNSHKSCPKRLLNRFMSAVISNATTNKPLIRHFSNSLMLSFWPKFGSCITNDVLKDIVHQIYLDAKELELPGQYRVGDANTWDIYQDLTLTGIFGGVLKKTTCADVPYFSETLFHKYLSPQANWPIGSDETSLWLNRKTDETTHATESIFDASSQLQMKSGAWKTLMDIDGTSSEKIVQRSDLIVVASLVDKAPNLGGICRLCDVLGVGLLTVPNINVKKNPQFKNVAVTADRWMPLEELSPKDIVYFMRCKKKEGYTLIGLEQTDKSVKLDDDYRFPQKSLILLGTEAHGIPGSLIAELDLCLEIKQFGVVRSMNIQTATAVIVHSYTVQHM